MTKQNLLGNKNSHSLLNFLCLVITSAILVFFSIDSHALETDFQSTPKNEGKSRLVSSGYQEADDFINAGIHVKLNGDWKTYWKMAGDSGMPFTIELKNQQNIKNYQFLWPAPKRFVEFDLESLGYKDEVLFPIKIYPENPEKEVRADINVKWALCDKICIFEDDNFSLEIPQGYRDESKDELFNKYLDTIPKSLGEQSLIKLSEFKISKNQIAIVINSELIITNKFDLFVVEESKNFKFSPPEISISDDEKEISFLISYESLISGLDLKGKTLEFTFSNYDNSVVFEKEIKKFDEIAQSSDDFAQKPDGSEAGGEVSVQQDESNNNSAIQIGLLEAIIAALIGGLILNIMPCVLPVLSLKVMSALKHGSSDLKFIRKSFTYTILGIITSFMALAALTLILKSIGAQVGWGIQFQQPAFLIFLSLVLVLFASNQFGWFEILLPTGISAKLNQAIESKGQASPWGNFLTGAFATLMATPCTAPFLTTAIGFALTAGSTMILLIFFFMGVGLAMPYIMVALFPKLVKRISPSSQEGQVPKKYVYSIFLGLSALWAIGFYSYSSSIEEATPLFLLFGYLAGPVLLTLLFAPFVFRAGSWMNSLKIGLGLLLLATVVWILYIFAVNAGLFAATTLFSVLGCILWFLWFAKKHQLDRTKTLLSMIYAAAMAFIIPLIFESVEKDSKEIQQKWVEFDRQQINELVEQDKVVFVDVTADWCITCKFNKLRVTNPMLPFFEEQEVILMKADYTKPSKKINQYLEYYGAYAIPFNMVYGPAKPEGIRLPEILDKGSVRKAVFDAQGN